MKNAQDKTSEVILIDGHKIILRYADRPQPKVMGNIQGRNEGCDFGAESIAP